MNKINAAFILGLKRLIIYSLKMNYLSLLLLVLSKVELLTKSAPINEEKYYNPGYLSTQFSEKMTAKIRKIAT